MRLEFWVLQCGPSYNPRWYCSDYERINKNSVKNILHGNRYSSEEEAREAAPDDSWEPKFVNWFEVAEKD